MKDFKELKCLIIDDKHDNIKGAREALIQLGLERSNIFPNSIDEQQLSDKIKGESIEELFPFLISLVKEKNIDFMLLDMKWKQGEIPPNTSGEKFTAYLENSNFNKMPIVGFSIYSEAEIKTSLVPVFYIQKDGGDMPPSRVISKFKDIIGTNALLRICNSNNHIDNLQDTIQEQKVIIHIFVEHVHSTSTEQIKKELEENKLYTHLREEERTMINTLVEYNEKSDANHYIVTKILSDPNAAPAIVNVFQAILKVVL